MLKDTRKTKAQLIEELDFERQKSARVDLSGVERQLAVERVPLSRMTSLPHRTWLLYEPDHCARQDGITVNLAVIADVPLCFIDFGQSDNGVPAHLPCLLL